MEKELSIIASGKQYILVQGKYCYQVFHKDTKSQVFGSFDLEVARKAFTRYERNS